VSVDLFVQPECRFPAQKGGGGRKPEDLDERFDLYPFGKSNETPTQGNVTAR